MNEYLLALWGIKKASRAYQSDFVRGRIALVNEAACRGHITCLSTAGKNMGYWALTTSGQEFLATYGNAP